MENRDPLQKSFTGREFVDAIAKNGLPQFKNDFFDYEIPGDDTEKMPEIIAACALGQAAINLGVFAKSLYDEINLNGFVPEDMFKDYEAFTYAFGPTAIGDYIAGLNDGGKTLAEIVEILKSNPKVYTDDIVFYVDKHEYQIAAGYYKTGQ